MKSDINLLPPAQLDAKKSQGILNVLRIGAIASLSVVLIASIILFFLIQQFSPSRLQKQENEIISSISKLRQKEAKLFVINDRIKGVSSIIKGRPNYTLWMDVLLKQIPADISINSMSVDKDKITLVTSSKSLLSINVLLNNLIELAKNKNTIKDVAIDSLTANVKDGGYSLSVTAATL